MTWKCGCCSCAQAFTRASPRPSMPYLGTVPREACKSVIVGKSRLCSWVPQSRVSFVRIIRKLGKVEWIVGTESATEAAKLSSPPEVRRGIWQYLFPSTRIFNCLLGISAGPRVLHDTRSHRLGFKRLDTRSKFGGNTVRPLLYRADSRTLQQGRSAESMNQ